MDSHVILFFVSVLIFFKQLHLTLSCVRTLTHEDTWASLTNGTYTQANIDTKNFIRLHEHIHLKASSLCCNICVHYENTTNNDAVCVYAHTLQSIRSSFSCIPCSVSVAQQLENMCFHTSFIVVSVSFVADKETNETIRTKWCDALL